MKRIVATAFAIALLALTFAGVGSAKVTPAPGPTSYGHVVPNPGPTSY